MFQFKQFRITQSHAAFKLGTDAVLLGAWAEVESYKHILDIGTGTGILALICAQKNSKAAITAIEPDPLSANDALNNFYNSPWSHRISLIQQRVQDFQPDNNLKFDCIISNPPYFEGQKKSATQRKNDARHTDGLPLVELASGISSLLHKDGDAYIVLPIEEGRLLMQLMAIRGLQCIARCLVSAKPNQVPIRMLCKYRQAIHYNPKESLLSIYDHSGQHYSNDYAQLTKPFYL